MQLSVCQKYFGPGESLIAFLDRDLLHACVFQRAMAQNEWSVRASLFESKHTLEGQYLKQIEGFSLICSVIYFGHR